MRINKIINWASPDLLPKNLIFIDGITRSGKSLVGPVVGSFNKVYPMQHQALLDNLMPICGDKNNRNVCEIDIDIKCHIAF